MRFYGDYKRICTHPLTTVPLASQNQINGWTEEKEGVNGREIRNIGKEWTNQKEHGGFGDGWYCCLLVITVSQEF